MDALIFGNLANLGYGLDYTHDEGHGVTLIMAHSMNVSNTIELSARFNFFPIENSIVKTSCFTNMMKFLQGEIYTAYGGCIEFEHIRRYAIAIAVQINNNEEAVVDFIVKKNIFTTSDSRTTVDVSIKATKSFSTINFTRPLNLIFELTFSRAVE